MTLTADLPEFVPSDSEDEDADQVTTVPNLPHIATQLDGMFDVNDNVNVSCDSDMS